MAAKKNVLLVDDRKENILVLESLLEHLPLTFYKANSGEAALKILLKEDIDLIFLDVRMSGMNGIETAELIRGMKKTRSIPIIFVSGVIEKEFEQLKKKYPDNIEYVIKPLDEDVIKRHVARYLNI
ncbi:MAG: response regulator [Calditrichaceae bacterium]|nr:response regulator [Calditrichaceae bacterium]MBN2710405.1 response regulator [Calditrichaceae bacterium]RQV92875.1 MAG: response regulator [Calditrichota bacterium]